MGRQVLAEPPERLADLFSRQDTLVGVGDPQPGGKVGRLPPPLAYVLQAVGGDEEVDGVAADVVAEGLPRRLLGLTQGGVLFENPMDVATKWVVPLQGSARRPDSRDPRVGQPPRPGLFGHVYRKSVPRLSHVGRNPHLTARPFVPVVGPPLTWIASLDYSSHTVLALPRFFIG